MQHSYAGYIHESVLLQQCDKAAQLHSESKLTPVAHAHLFSFDVRNEYSMRRLTFVPLINNVISVIFVANTLQFRFTLLEMAR
jgi:hypothetical protein